MKFHLSLEQPDSWDEEEDGLWKPPKIPNPAYKGPWKPKVRPFIVLLESS